MFEAYFDESGTGRRIFAVGGFVGPTDEWAIFAQEWEAIIKPLGISAYHAADCEGGYREFKDWPQKKRDNLTIALVDCLEKRKIFGIGIGAIVEDFKEVMPTSPETLWCDLYVELFELVLINAVGRIVERAPGQHLAVFCDRQQEFQHAATQAFWALADEPEWDYRNNLENITFTSREKFPPLQAADKAAYETHKLYTNQLYDPKRAARMAMYRFFDHPFYTAYCDKHSFLAMKNQRERRLGNLEFMG